LDIGTLNAFIDTRISPILIVVVLVLLIRIVRWIADDDRNLTAILPPYMGNVLLRHGAEQIMLVTSPNAQPTYIIKRIDEAEVWKFFIL
ncbi:hypothetical protein, partial [Stenotrophomonas maltophilia]|uniref:hypothetical protein n=1 Tax=Stenotrophomonas maltophilia TaxID=40324 RepID=UPI0019540B19